jgi:hypothetical protein
MKDRDSVETGSIAEVYLQEVRTLRTRSCVIDIPQRENDVTIQHTLLGIELKVGRQRFSCPDLATARYMRVFARLGCREFAIPYDITKISAIADELETAWQRALLVLDTKPDVSPQQHRRRRSQLVKAVRTAISDAGPGAKMPEFNQSTKQRQS